MIYGDTAQDGERYSANTLGTPDKDATPFANPGADILDARQSPRSMVIDGGPGNDSIWASQAGDHIAGGIGDDQIHGGVGNDQIYGDSAFNVSTHSYCGFATVVLQRILTVVTTADAAGGDTIDDSGGDNIIFGDHGIVTLANEISGFSALGVPTTVGASDLVDISPMVDGYFGRDAAPGSDGTDARPRHRCAVAISRPGCGCRCSTTGR